jgi:hypothetical protein
MKITRIETMPINVPIEPALVGHDPRAMEAALPRGGVEPS